MNPEIVDIGDTDFSVWDDCFSIPDLFVRVTRAYRVAIRYQDLAGETHDLVADGALSELLQHEIDHLDGVLTIDGAMGLDPFCHREEWNKHWAEGGLYGPPTMRHEPVEASTL